MFPPLIVEVSKMRFSFFAGLAAVCSSASNDSGMSLIDPEDLVNFLQDGETLEDIDMDALIAFWTEDEQIPAQEPLVLSASGSDATNSPIVEDAISMARVTRYKGTAREAFNLLIDHPNAASIDQILFYPRSIGTTHAILDKIETYIEKFSSVRKIPRNIADTIHRTVMESPPNLPQGTFLSETPENYANFVSRKLKTQFDSQMFTRSIPILFYIRYCLRNDQHSSIVNVCPLQHDEQGEQFYFMSNDIWRRCLELEGLTPFMRLLRSLRSSPRNNEQRQSDENL